MMQDPFDLQRFVLAQRDVFGEALAELRAGHKRGHWMWFIFPQLDGLGTSAMATRYALHSLADAKAYLAHPVLGPRLRSCAHALLDHAGTPARAILGSPDCLKLRSSATLFARVDHADPPAAKVFTRVLETFYAGVADPLTLRLLAHDPDA